MKIIECLQGSLEWMEARAGIPTASEMDNLVSPTGKIRTGQMPETYLNQKLAEWWIGGPLPTWSNHQTAEMEFGNILEEKAKPWFEWTYGQKIMTVGLITTDDGRFGCSPDGLLGDNEGLEIKCPSMPVHIGYLRAGVVPPEYVLQVQTSLFITERIRWTFVSFQSQLPKLVLQVEPDEELHDTILSAVEMFWEKFEVGKKRLEELHGGPRPVREKFNPHKYEQPEMEPCDITP